MKLLHISLINSCNRTCYYCPMKKWLRPLEDAQKEGMNLLTNAALLKWVGAYFEPAEWIIEITGGEPGLYPEIRTLIPELSNRGYHGLVKTNGSLPIPASKNFQRITAWHEGVGEIPAHYDQILIIENPRDDWERKARYCEENGIPYQTVQFDRKFEGKQFDSSVCTPTKFLSLVHVNSSGRITECPAMRPVRGRDIFNMCPPVSFNCFVPKCRRCKIMNDDEKFLLPYLREKLEKDYTAQVTEPASTAELNRRLAAYNNEKAKARAEVDENYAAERKAAIMALLAVKTQPGWPSEVEWPE